MSWGGGGGGVGVAKGMDTRSNGKWLDLVDLVDVKGEGTF